jgi:hypothetical protein
MALSRIAQQHADEIKQHDWSDSPYRLDRAGHDRISDSRGKTPGKSLDAWETECVRQNAMWVTAQVLAYNDPNFDVVEFADACGVNTKTTTGRTSGSIAAGLRSFAGSYAIPGTYWEFDDVEEDDSNL